MNNLLISYIKHALLFNILSYTNIIHYKSHFIYKLQIMRFN